MVADYVHPLVGAQFVCVAVPQGEKLRIVATAEETERSIKYSATRDDNFSSFVCDRCLQSVVLSKRYKVNPDIQNQAYCQFCQSTAKIWGWRGMAIIPLLANEELVGVLATYADCPNFFDAPKIARLMALASQAAIAIQNAHYFATLEAQQVALQQLSVRLVTAQEEERRQLSRELHDEMGQTLTALRINLDLTQRLLPPHMPDKLRNALTEARRLAILTQETARNLSLQLRPAVLDDLGLVSALRWKLNQHKQRTNQMVHFEVDLPEVALRPELEITIYRIVGEALTNIVRHAQASQTCVSLKIKGDELLVSIEDDGVGFKSASKRASVQHSLGLINMQERAQLLGGHLQINSKIGQGTLVQANFPRPFFYQNKEIQI
jgi:signal transduction histidine kinase